MDTIQKRKVEPKNLSTVEDYARIMGISIQTVYRWLKDGKVKKVEFLGREFIDRSTWKG